MSKIRKPISIVIPTLGNKNLISTLNSIQNSSVDVCEVIIVIPENFSFDFDLSKFNALNIIVHRTFKGGQVFQRSEGFKIVKSNYVLQLDDDIEFDEYLIENLLLTLTSLPINTSISPLLTNYSKQSVYSSSFSLLSRIFYAFFYFDFLLREGSINKFGKSIGIKTYNKLIKVDWLPGGCVLHNKQNLIYENYFKFETKAFMEDLFHSFLLKSNDINLFIDSNEFAIIVEPKNELKVDKLFRDKLNELKIRKYYFELTGLNKINYYWSCFVDLGITFIKYLYLKAREK